jgi:hypothetical protein
LFLCLNRKNAAINARIAPRMKVPIATPVTSPALSLLVLWPFSAASTVPTVAGPGSGAIDVDVLSVALELGGTVTLIVVFIVMVDPVLSVIVVAMLVRSG